MIRKAKLLIWLLCILVLAAAPKIFGYTLVSEPANPPKIIYADADGAGTNDGSSWENAYTFLQDALVDASSSEKPVEIRVAQGVYKPDQGTGIIPGDREATFWLIDGVNLKGGYVGFGEPDPNARIVELYETILTGDLNGNDNEAENQPETDSGLLSDNSCRVVVADSTNETAILDGFTITGNYNHRNLCERGGAMVVKAGNPTVRNCHYTGVGDSTQPWFSRGGAAASSLVIRDAARPNLMNCRFTDNQSGAVNIDSNPVFTDCIFENNAYTLEARGGSIKSLNCTFLDNLNGIGLSDAEASLTGCTFERTIGTGVSLISSKITLTDCTFESTREYGALGIRGGDVTLERCVFNNNTGHEGGAINFVDGILVASDCMFTNNKSGDGGAIRFVGTLDLRNCHFRGNYSELEGGALAGYSEEPVVISGCTFVGNTAEFGGAISYHGPSIVISNCTFADNRGFGPAVFAIGGLEQNVEFSQCIIWNGQTPFQPEQWEWWASPKVEYSDIEGGWSGIGNIDVDPFFASPGYWDPNEMPDDPNDDIWIDGDYHLKSQAGRWDPISESWIQDDVTSPCIDAGDPNSPVAFEPYPNGGVINMGAYGGTVEASMSPSGLNAKYGGGTGEPDNPYLIYTAEQMNTIGSEPNDWDKHFKLMADIDLADYTDNQFNIIGTYDNPFIGVFDGNGHTISNLTYVVTGDEERTDERFVSNFGLFGSIEDPNAVIKDLGLVNPDIKPASICPLRVWGVGALVGSLGRGLVSNCYVEGGQVLGESYVGGLIGSNYGIISDCHTTCTVMPAEQRPLPPVVEQLDRRRFFGGLVGLSSGEIYDCNTTGDVTGGWSVGGLIGEAYGIISNSWSGIDVSGDRAIGGLVGKARTIEISHCYANGHVSGQRSVGGLIGNCTENGNIISCSATGSITAEQDAGGLVGWHGGTFSECYATGSVFVYADNAGGLVGRNGGTVLTSWACGNVAGKQYIGGLVGQNWESEDRFSSYDPIVTDSYAKGRVRGEDGIGGLVGYNQGGTVSRCYSTGEVIGTMEDSFVGGLIGIDSDTVEGEIEASFWDTETSGLGLSDGGEGKTTSEMQMASTFLEVHWDFMDEAGNGTEDIWWVLEGQDYPRLYWEIMTDADCLEEEQ